MARSLYVETKASIQTGSLSIRGGKIDTPDRESWPSALQYTVKYALLPFPLTHKHTHIYKHTPSHTICLQSSLWHNCSDIYIYTWSLSASFHYLEPDLDRGGQEWKLDDWNECRSKCTWKSYSETKPSSPPSHSITHSMIVLKRGTR